MRRTEPAAETTAAQVHRIPRQSCGAGRDRSAPVARRLLRRKEVFGLLYCLQPGFIQLNFIFTAAEQRDTKGCFHMFHSARKRWLGYMKRLRGAGQGALLCKSDKLLKL